MITLVAVYLFFLGLCFGSFALVLTDRMHSKRDWVRGRSKCDECHRELQIKDLVPVGSWVFYGGKCRRCGVKLSKSYPLAELFLGFGFLLSFIFWPAEHVGFISILMFIVWLAALVVMTALFVYDLRWFLLPNKLVYPLVITGVAWMALDIIDKGVSNVLLLEYILSVFVAAGFFLLLFMTSGGRWIGDGDIRLGLAIGLFTGSWAESWLVIFLASVFGLVFALPAFAETKNANKRLKLKIPFGPVLILALVVVMLFGEQIIDWYATDILLL